MRCCVTGGAGFIGSNLVDRLLADGHEVAVLDNLSTGRIENLRESLPNVRFVEGDLRDPEAVAEASEGAEVVFHQAALAAVARSIDRPQEVNEVNVTGTLNVLLAARDAGARRVVFASSSSVYGDTPTLPKREDMPLSPRSPYAASKAAGEAYLQAFGAAFGLEGVSLRYFNVYGPRQSPKSQYAAVVPLFVQALRDGKPVQVFGDGQQSRDFTYVGDVAEALVLAAGAPAASGAINLAGGRATTILALAKMIADSLDTPLRVAHAPARRGDVRHSLADLTRARDLLGWTPRTPMADGIAEVVRAAGAFTSS